MPLISNDIFLISFLIFFTKKLITNLNVPDSAAKIKFAHFCTIL